MLQELRIDVDANDIRAAIRERLREYDDGGREARSIAECADNAWRVVQNLLAEELAELNEGLAVEAKITEKDRLALPDGGQAIDIVYRDHKFSIVRPKDKRHLALVDPTAQLLSPVVPRVLPRVPTPVQVDHMLRGFPNTLTGLRDQALLRNGVRSVEVGNF